MLRRRWDEDVFIVGDHAVNVADDAISSVKLLSGDRILKNHGEKPY